MTQFQSSTKILSSISFTFLMHPSWTKRTTQRLICALSLSIQSKFLNASNVIAWHSIYCEWNLKPFPGKVFHLFLFCLVLATLYVKKKMFYSIRMVVHNGCIGVQLAHLTFHFNNSVQISEILRTLLIDFILLIAK